MKGLMRSLVLHGRVKTTLPKAKELRPMAEKLITRARKGGLFNRRLVIARIGDVEAGSYLVDKVAPKLTRESGYLRIARLESRQGDNAAMAEISFVDDLTTEVAAATKTAAPKAKASAAKKGEK
jgi:large subunit ribosomal protein L17